MFRTLSNRLARQYRRPQPRQLMHSRAVHVAVECLETRVLLSGTYENTADLFDPLESVSLIGDAGHAQGVSFDLLTGVETLLPWQDVFAASGLASGSTDGFGGLASAFNAPGTHVPVLETVHGDDDRVEVADPLSFPARTAVKLQMTFPNNANFSGSGIMISEFHVLTAGHNVFDDDEGGWATSIQASVAQDDLTESGGDRGKWYGTANATNLRSYTGWTQNGLADWDWGLITLDRSVGTSSGWAGAQWWSDNSVFDGLQVETFGYPGDLQNGRDMYRAAGPTDNATDLRVYYSGNSGLDTFRGQSGSGVIHNDGTVNRAVAVHAYGGTTLNSAPRMTEQRFNDLNNTWIPGDATPTNRPDLIAWDDWFDTSYASISTTTASPGQAFSVTTPVRNNGTVTAAASTVSFYASTNTIISTGDTLLGTASLNSITPYAWQNATWSGTLPNLNAGNYYVGWIIDSANNNTEFLEGNNTGYIGNQVLTVTVDPDDQISEATTLAFGTTTTADLDSGIDVDMYSVSVTAGQRILFDIDTPNSSLDSYLRVFDVNGIEIDFNDDGNNAGPPPEDSDLDSFLDHTFATAGTYYIGISAFGNSGYNPTTGGNDQTASSTGQYELTVTNVPSTIFMDNGDPGFSTINGSRPDAGDNWFASNIEGREGDVHYTGLGDGSAIARWEFTGLTAGNYRVSATWSAHPNRATNAPFTVFDSIGGNVLTETALNQRQTPDDRNDDGSNWEDIGIVSISGNTLVVELNNSANGYVVADAIRIEATTDPLPDLPKIIDDQPNGTPFAVTSGFLQSPIGEGRSGDVRYAAAGNGSEKATWTFTGLTEGGTYTVAATWSAHNNRATNSPFRILDGTGGPELDLVRVNQEKAPIEFNDQGSDWKHLSVVTITGTELVVELSNDANQYVIADAIRIEKDGTPPPPPPPTVKTLIDNGDDEFSTVGGWNASPISEGHNGNVHYHSAGNGSAVATWTFTGLMAGEYQVAATWSTHANRATDAPYTIRNGVGGNIVGQVDINQEQAPNDFFADDSNWENLATVTITGDTLVVQLSNNANQYVIADAIRIQEVTPDVQLANQAARASTSTALPWWRLDEQTDRGTLPITDEQAFRRTRRWGRS